MVYISTKFALDQRTLDRKSDMFQKYVSIRQEKTIAGRNICKIDKKWFPLPRKPVSTNQNAGLI